MNIRRHVSTLGFLLAATLCAKSALAGQFKRITIDGSFEDWAGVAPATTDPQEGASPFDFKEVYLANDDQYLYVRVKLYTQADFGAFNLDLFLDADANPATGFSSFGVGSELLIQNGTGYQEKNGGFNEGEATDLDWASAPTGLLTEFEARISRNVRDADGLLILTNSSILLAVEVEDSNWSTKDVAPDTGGMSYDFAPTPARATGSTTLVSLSNTVWRCNDTGTDLGTNWLATDYDDTQAGWKTGSGLFGFGVPPGTYPAPVQTTLTSGRTAYYLRVPFTWDYDSTGIALAVDNYLSAGAMLYLNGAEVRRVRLPDGPVGYSTLATGGPATPGQAESFTLLPGALVVGANILEVEVHQAAATPADLAFGLRLVATDSLAPSIEDPTLPADRTVVEGEATSFSAGTVFGTTPLFYQWFKGGVAIEAATNASLVLPVVLVGDGGQYRVEITNATGVKATSRSAQLTTTALPVSITNGAEPADRILTEGESTTFSVSIAGSPTFFYQWSKDGTPIDGATAAEYTITNAVLGDTGDYSVVVSNRLNQVPSRAAHLQVVRDLNPPWIAGVTGSATHVWVQFSEPVDGTSANAATNYTLTGGMTVQAALLDPADPRSVTLTTTALSFGAVYTLGVGEVQDRFGNPARTTTSFRASIRIDGDFEDWAGIAPAATETQDTPEGKEFKNLYVTNDDDYLYVRFSFYTNIGQLPVDAYFHIFSDTDADAATGYVAAGVGSEMMIENGLGYQQQAGQLNAGSVSGLDFSLAPAAASAEFECRISRKATYDSDGQTVYTNATIALAFELLSSTWASLDTAPQSGGLVYTFAKPTPIAADLLRLQAHRSGDRIQLAWPFGAVLEAKDRLTGGDWAPVTGATSPYSPSPTGDQRYFRLRL